VGGGGGLKMGLTRQRSGTPQRLYSAYPEPDTLPHAASESGVHDAKAAELLTLPLVVISHLVTFCRIN
jgi:hypothetical protein